MYYLDVFLKKLLYKYVLYDLNVFNGLARQDEITLFILYLMSCYIIIGFIFSLV